MPSPLGHGLAGLAVHLLGSEDRAALRNPWRIGLTVGAALLPDLDLLGKLVDSRNHHGQEFHSIGFALLAAAGAALVAFLLRWRAPLRTGLLVGAAWASHVLLDYLNVDTHPPIGILAAWPLSHAYWKAPVPIFMDIGRTLEWTTVRHNVVAGAWECAVFVPVLLVCWRFKWRSGA